MLRAAPSLLRRSARAYSSSSSHVKVAVLGAAGGIGQPLSLLCKLSDSIDEVACYDVVGTPGVAADLSHCPTKAVITGDLPSAGTWPPSGNSGLERTLTGASVVVIPAGVPRKPGMTRDDLFNTNASIVQTLVEGCAKYCPDATLAIISNPVNSTVPIAAEVLKKAGVYKPAKLCGVTTLDVCRANTFLAEKLGCSPKDIDVTVIGGHAGITILPLLSQVPGASSLPADVLDALTVRIQFGGDEVVKAKAGSGSATLSMAYAGYLFTEGVIKAMRGEEVVQCAYVESTLTSAQYFASPCKFGPDGGVAEVLPFGPLSSYEQGWLDKLLPDLQKQIDKGVSFVK
jgi:malate dehydrogenase